MPNYVFTILIISSLFVSLFADINWENQGLPCPPTWRAGAPTGCTCTGYWRESGPGDYLIDACAICCTMGGVSWSTPSFYIYNIIGDNLHCACDARCRPTAVLTRRRLSEGEPNELRCPACDGEARGYVVVDDGVERTFQEAQEHCRNAYGSDLVSINTVEEAECPCDFLNTITEDLGPAWIGLWHPKSMAILHKDPYYFENIDGSDCREYHNEHTNTCGSADIWEMVYRCFEGSRCVYIDPFTCKISNDIACETKLKFAVCNAEGSATGEMPSFEELQ